jgi:hypothetical protein
MSCHRDGSIPKLNDFLTLDDPGDPFRHKTLNRDVLEVVPLGSS